MRRRPCPNSNITTQTFLKKPRKDFRQFGQMQWGPSQTFAEVRKCKNHISLSSDVSAAPNCQLIHFSLALVHFRRQISSSWEKFRVSILGPLYCSSKPKKRNFFVRPRIFDEWQMPEVEGPFTKISFQAAAAASWLKISRRKWTLRASTTLCAFCKDGRNKMNILKSFLNPKFKVWYKQ